MDSSQLFAPFEGDFLQVLFDNHSSAPLTRTLHLVMWTCKGGWVNGRPQQLLPLPLPHQNQFSREGAKIGPADRIQCAQLSMLGHIVAKKVVYLKFKFNWVSPPLPLKLATLIWGFRMEKALALPLSQDIVL